MLLNVGVSGFGGDTSLKGYSTRLVSHLGLEKFKNRRLVSVLSRFEDPESKLGVWGLGVELGLQGLDDTDRFYRSPLFRSKYTKLKALENQTMVPCIMVARPALVFCLLMCSGVCNYFSVLSVKTGFVRRL